ncbi:MAG: hypothetical protein ACOYOI_04290, partial [Chthoniobacterales bacterium]
GDLVLTKDVLYQLSYMGLPGPKTGQVLKEHWPKGCRGRFHKFLKVSTAARVTQNDGNATMLSEKKRKERMLCRSSSVKSNFRGASHRHLVA